MSKLSKKVEETYLKYYSGIVELARYMCAKDIGKELGIHETQVRRILNIYNERTGKDLKFARKPKTDILENFVPCYSHLLISKWDKNLNLGIA